MIALEQRNDRDNDPAEMPNSLTRTEHFAVLKPLKAEIEQHRKNALKQ